MHIFVVCLSTTTQSVKCLEVPTIIPVLLKTTHRLTPKQNVMHFVFYTWTWHIFMIAIPFPLTIKSYKYLSVKSCLTSWLEHSKQSDYILSVNVCILILKFLPFWGMVLQRSQTIYDDTYLSIINFKLYEKWKHDL